MRSIIYLMMTSLIGQVAALAFTPLLSRIYSVSEFGMLGLAVSIGGMAGIILSAKSEMLMLREESEDVNQYYSDSVNFCFLMSGFGLVVVFAISLLELAEVYLSLMVLFGALGTAIFSVTRVYLNVKSQFRKSGAINAARGACQPVIQILLSDITFGLVAGWAVSFYVVLMFVARKARRTIFQSIKAIFSKVSIVSKIFVSALISEFTVGFIIISCMILYSSQMSGYVVMVYRVLGFPVMIISRAIADYMLPKYKGYYLGRNSLAEMFLPFSFALTAALLIVAVFSFVPQHWYTLFLGEGWEGVSTFFIVLAPFFAVRLLSIIASPIYLVFHKEGLYLLFSVVLLVGFLTIAIWFYIDSDREMYEYIKSIVIYGALCYTLYVAGGVALLVKKLKGRKIPC